MTRRSGIARRHPAAQGSGRDVPPAHPGAREDKLMPSAGFCATLR